MHPTLLELNLGFITIPFHTYGFMFALGFLSAVYVARKLAIRSKVDPDMVADLCFWLLLWGAIGARALFVITRIDYFIQNPLDIVKVWEGGLVFFGGLLGATAYAVMFFKKKNLSIWKMTDILAPAITIGHVFGRTGCLSAGCCYGKPTDVPWAIRLNSELVDISHRGIPIHPTQIYEGVSLLILFFGLIHIYKNKKFDGQVVLTYFMVYPVIRSIVEIYRGDSIRGFIIQDVISTSQFISFLVFIGAAILLNYRLKTSTKNRRS